MGLCHFTRQGARCRRVGFNPKQTRSHPLHAILRQLSAGQVVGVFDEKLLDLVRDRGKPVQDLLALGAADQNRLGFDDLGIVREELRVSSTFRRRLSA